jgi:DNA-directed RNA polymerase specialized sigma24 family protein
MNFDDLVDNEEVRKIGNAAAKSFRKFLSKEEIDSCIMIALWRVTKEFDSEKGKFSTYLYRGVVLECLTAWKFNTDKKRTNKKVTEKNPLLKSEYNEEIADIEAVDFVKNFEYPELMIDRFWSNKTLSEIAKTNNVSVETVRIRIKKNLENMKSTLE